MEPSGARPFVNSHEVRAAPDPGGDGEAFSVGVRPYLITGGRASPIDTSLRIEAQVLTTDDGASSIRMLTYERRDIVDLCRNPHAVAELAAKLNMHLGVARVLVGDLVVLGMLSIRRPETTGNRTHIIERVIRGLQAIS